MKINTGTMAELHHYVYLRQRWFKVYWFSGGTLEIWFGRRWITVSL